MNNLCSKVRAGGCDGFTECHHRARVSDAVQRENVYQNFTFTRRATRAAVVLGLVIPGTVALIAMAYDVSSSILFAFSAWTYTAKTGSHIPRGLLITHRKSSIGQENEEEQV